MDLLVFSCCAKNMLTLNLTHSQFNTENREIAIIDTVKPLCVTWSIVHGDDNVTNDQFCQPLIYNLYLAVNIIVGLHIMVKKWSHPSAGLVIMQIHELSTMAESTRLLSTLPLADINEILSKPVQRKYTKLVRSNRSRGIALSSRVYQ
jgi:hypothetical protein